jgi:hypothetical protein
MTIANTLYAGLLQAAEACSADDKADRAKNWLSRCHQIITMPASCSDDFQRSIAHHFAIAQRRLAGLPLLSDETLDTLRKAGVIAPQQWSMGDLGRALLLLHTLLLLPDAEHASFVMRLYQRGDSTEQQAILRSLILLPEPQRWVSIATEGCRSNVAIVFEAIACDNAYPERFLCELSFNQLVLKSLFTGISIRRIAGLNKRLTPTLKRMVADYASERRVAKRQISDDLNFLLRGIEHENV